MPARRQRIPHAASPKAPVAALIDRLDRSRNRFTPEDRAAKQEALLALASRPLRDPALLLRFHEALCFLRAYPDDAELLQFVEDALREFGARVQTVRATGRPNVIEELEETGVARTTIYCPLSFPAARWLTTRFADEVEIDWDDAESEERLGAILPFLVGLADEEALVEMGVSYRAWLASAKGNDARSDLGWMLDRLERAPIEATARRALYDGLRLRIRWDLRETSASRTLAKVPLARVFFHRGPLVRYRGPLSRLLPGPRVAVGLASSGESIALLDAARASVAVRYREIHGFNFADPADVLVADVGRGVRIAWFGLLPEHRLPLRAHYGYLLLKNGVPMGYGDASLLCDWAEVAFNIFETFRPGESAFVFVRLLAFLHQHFHIRTFHLGRYQIGYDNDEAIQSGAFWFYYKLGFRSKRADLRRLSTDERRRIARDPTYRSSRQTLEQLCQDGMVVSVGRRLDPRNHAFDVQRVGCRAALDSGGPIASEVARSLGMTRWRTWPQRERLAFERLAPVLGAISDLPDWSVRERGALVDVIRAKGGPREADYLRRMQAHVRLRDSLLRLGAPGTL
jgi:hypothetical protein